MTIRSKACSWQSSLPLSSNEETRGGPASGTLFLTGMVAMGGLMGCRRGAP